MSLRPRLTRAVHLACRLLARLAARLARRRRPGVRLTVLAADDRQRRATERLLRRGIRYIEAALDAPFPANAVVVQLALPNAEPGCSLTTASERVVIRLGLCAGGRWRSPDELVATLADQALVLSAPVPLAALRPTRIVPAQVLPPDPLAPTSFEPTPVRAA